MSIKSMSMLEPLAVARGSVRPPFEPSSVVTEPRLQGAAPMAYLPLLALLLTTAASLPGQAQPDMRLRTSTAERPAIAVADMRGTGDAQRHMDTFNSTLWDELSNAGILKMVAKSVYPLEVPQRPQDFKPPSVPVNARRGTPPVRSGPWLTDWSGPPVSANYLAFGY